MVETIGTPDYDIRYASWQATFLSVFIWALTYQTLRIILAEKSGEYCSRILSFVHGVITAFIGINQCFVIDNPFDHPEWRTTNSQRFLMVCSLGYFIHDFVWIAIYQREQRLMMLHHLYSVLALQHMLHKPNSGAQATCALGSMELSNPLLQIRWFLRSEGYYPSVLYTSVETTFVIVFFLVRIVLGTYFLLIISFQERNDWDVRILGASIYIMSWFFLVGIVKYLHNKYGLGANNSDIRNKGT